MAAKKTPKNANSKKSDDGKRMDALTLLVKDHDTVRGLLTEMEGTSERSLKRRRDLLTQIGVEVRVHAQIEEEIFYLAYHSATESKDDEKLFFEATEEHALVDIVLEALESTEPDADEFGAKAKVLKDLIEHHAEEEEEEMFPRAKKLLGRERLLELGAELMSRQTALKKELRGAPQSSGARQTPSRSRGSAAAAG